MVFAHEAGTASEVRLVSVLSTGVVNFGLPNAAGKLRHNGQRNPTQDREEAYVVVG